MATKKVKVKVKKKKLNIKKFLITFFLIISLIILVFFILKMPVKNIYITGNNIVSDKEIIKLASLENYPAYITTYFSDIKKNIMKNDYIKNVTITRKLFNKIYIEVEEYKPLAIYKEKLILSSSSQVSNDYQITYIPYITNDIDSIYDEFVKDFSKVDDDILLKISHIEYVPNEVDNERFLLYMIDSNYVYITLSKVNKINKYNSIVTQLENKKGIIYLDSGDYVEIKG